MRKKFDEIFKTNRDGTLSPKYLLSVDDIKLGPGVSFGREASFGGVDFFSLKGVDMEVEKSKNDVLIVRGFYIDEKK